MAQVPAPPPPPPPPMPAPAPAVTRSASSNARILIALAIGAVVFLSLGIYGKVHDPTGQSLITLFFTETITLKVWLATAAFVLAIGQLLGGLRMYGKLGRKRGPKWIRTGHRIAGTGAFLLTIPVAYHCLWALGFHLDEGRRVLVHGIAGCFFFGALTAKVIVVEWRRMPRWALPTLGGLLFAALTIVWITSALWFFKTTGFKL
ncbi:MAG TPA: DUF6529 family protein [Actinomycetota bacterium]